MSDDAEKLRYFLKRVTANLHETRQRLQDIEAAAKEPVAIVGMGCRFPGGVQSPEDLWDLLAAGTDAISGFPADRGWDLDGEGGFLYDVAEFDPEFFGISPREALAMDPQQRLLLQVSWEALERAGINPVSLRGSSTGVFAGASPSGYGWLSGEQGEFDAHLMTGNATSVLSGRVAYSFGLEGPAVTVDTACSSALVAMHLACQSLRSGECSLALVGGVFVAATPVVFTDFSRQLGLSPSGRCKAFGAGADGMGVSEGAGILVVERLSDARRNGHHVLAVVRGSAMNQDGASNGLTAPNGPSQQRVIWAALANAGVRADQVDVVEAHGTGTSLGDPIEAQALLATYGRDRPEGHPLWLGSVKSNIGHAQQAAGAAALIKMVMAHVHQELPRTLHADEPSSHVDWSAGEVRLLTEPVPWPSASDTGSDVAGDAASRRTRRAGISGFGMSGTNVHLILEEAPRQGSGEESTAADAGGGRAEEAALPDAAGTETGRPGEARVVSAAAVSAVSAASSVLAPGTEATAWLVSGRSAPALAAQAGRLLRWAGARRELNSAAVGRSLATTRSAFEHRAAVIGTAAGELTAGLGVIAAGERVPGVLTGTTNARGPGRVAFVFAGQGSQWAGMGADLAAASPVFASRLAECERALRQYVDWSLTDVLSGPVPANPVLANPVLANPVLANPVPSGAGAAQDLDRVDVSQPALWAVMVSLAAVWEAAGVTPDAVTGHSQGEVAAATVAGILSLDDAARLVTVRSRALAAMDDAGGMLSVVMPAPAVRELLSQWPGRLYVAAVNSPAATVVSGDRAALAELQAELAARRVLRWPVPDTGFVAHSAGLGELASVFDSELAALRPQAGRIPMYSTVTGQLIEGSSLDAGYWFDNVRREVAFSTAIETLAGAGHRVFIEVSPHPVLTTAIAETLGEAAPGAVPVITGTLDRADGGPRRLLASLAAAHVAGVRIDWASVLAPAPRADLPTYAFQNQRYWMSPARPKADPAAAAPVREHASDSLAAGADSTRTVADWRYQVTWKPVPDPGPGVLSGNWLVVVPAGLRVGTVSVSEGPAGAGSIGEAVARALTIGGATVSTVEVPHCEGAREVLAAQLNSAISNSAISNSASSNSAISAGAASDNAVVGPVAGVVSLLALDESPLPATPAVPSGLAATLGLLQALGDADVDAALWVLTAGAVAAVPGERLARPVQAQAWGMGRAAANEHPDRWGGLIDLPPALGEPVLGEPVLGEPVSGEPAPGGRPALDDRTGARLCMVLAGCGEDQVAIRSAGIMVRRLARASQSRATRSQSDHHRAGQHGADYSPGAGWWAPRGTSLVTGGTGAIGGHVARWLARRGAPALLLASRSGPAAPGAAALAADLAAAGASVRVVACDVASRDELAGLIGWPAAGRHTGVGDTGLPGTGGSPPLTGVFHAAVAVSDGVLDRQDPGRMATVLAAKAVGAMVLDELTADLELDAFVLFSAVAGTLGGAGQGGYAAANAYLDALAENRRSRGLPGLAVAWGPWAGGGLADANEATRARLRRNRWEGLMDPALAIQALDWAMSETAAFAVVMDVDWPALVTVPGAVDMTKVPFLRDLPEVRQVVESLRAGAAGPLAAGPAAGGLAARVAGLSAAEQEAVLVRLVRFEAAAILGHASPDAVDQDRAFSEMGFDSLTAVELRNRLAAETALKLPATLLFDYPTPSVLAGHLRVELTGDQAITSAAVHTSADGEPIAIVGMGCRFPGGVRSPEELWELLAAGGDAISGYPADRGWTEGPFQAEQAGAGVDYARAGGFVHEAAEFDPGFFGISPREATAMDPQQRLLLEIAWEALEHAGIDPATLRGSQTGVFAGGYATGYGIGLYLGGGGPGELEGHLMTGGATAVISGRVSYVLGLEGPAVTIDTACSSSLVALHLACQALRSGECSLALAGGVTIMATPWEMAGMARQSGLSSDGRCKAFGATADGMGMAEGAGVLVVERLSDATRNGHRVLAVVAGSAINQDGASNGLTAPNGPSQQRVIRAALAKSGTAPAEVDVVEAHGTGTALGDPIEAQALMATYGRDRPQGRPLLLGSVKSNIGHTQAAAGVAGVMKMVLALRHQELPRTLHAGEPSPHIDWSPGDVRLLTEPVPWPAGERPRRAGVSSFGLSGTNAHVIIEEAPAAPQTAPAVVASLLAPGTGIPDEPGVIMGAGQAKTPDTVAGLAETALAVPSVLPPGRALPDGQPVLPAGVAWLVSAKTAEAVTGQAARLAEWAAARPGLAPADVAWSLATTRSVFGHRAVVTGTSLDDLIAGLRALAAGVPDVVPTGKPAAMAAGGGSGSRAAGQPADRPLNQAAPAGDFGVVTGSVSAGGPGRVGFLFSGQGSQRTGMAAGLYAGSPVFAAAFDEAAGLLEELLGVPVAEVALGRTADGAVPASAAPARDDGFGGAGGAADVGQAGRCDDPDSAVDPRVNQTLFAQPCLFAVQAGLVALLAACGVTPTAVAGHSVGEVAAAHAAGVLSLEDACRLVAARARGMAGLAEGGAMCAIAAPEAEVAAVLAAAGFAAGIGAAPGSGAARTAHAAAGHQADAALGGREGPVSGDDGAFSPGGRVEIAAVNGPSAVVVSGDEDPVRRVAEVFAGRGVRTRMLRVSHAFHSARMDPMLAELDEAARELVHAAPGVAWAGAIDGVLVTEPDAGYWAAAARQPVRFADVVATLVAEGVRVFIEIGPDGTLSALGPAAADAATTEGGPAGQAAADRTIGDDGSGETPRALFVPVQRPGTQAADSLLTALASVHVTGVAVDWAAVLPTGESIELPTYAFQRQRYWAGAEVPAAGAAATGVTSAKGAAGNTAGTAAEARFWVAVERGDLEAVAGALAVDSRLPLTQVLPALASWRRRQQAESAVAAWRYRIGWTPVPDPGAVVLSGTWLLVVPEGDRDTGLAGWCAAALAARGARVVTVPATVNRQALATSISTMLTDEAAGVPGNQPLAGVLSLVALAEAPESGYPSVPSGLAATLALVQALGDAGVAAPLWVVTRGAVAAAPGEALPSPAQAQAWGLGRVVGLEHPDRWGGLIDLPPVTGTPPPGAGSLASAGRSVLGERLGARLCAVLAGCGEDQVAIRAAGIMGRRLVRFTGSRPVRTWAPAGSTLITGGTGAVGGRVARWLTERGATDLVLTSRSGPVGGGVPALAAALAAAGTAVRVLCCDSADRGALAGLLGRLAAGGPRLTAVFHTAAVTDDGVLDRLDAARLATVLAAKAAGARHLDELTADLELDAFVLFSSVAGTIGGAGQGNYAAANAYLDALADSRRARGLAATSIAWGPWAGGGMAEASETVRARLRRGPMSPMDPQLAIGLLGAAIGGPDSVLAVVDMDWARLASAPDAGDLRRIPLLRELPDVAGLAPVAVGRGRRELTERLAGLSASAQARLLTDLVRAESAAVLGHASAASVEPRRAFSDLGFDSLTAVELRNRLEALTGLRLPATVAFDYPAAAALAGFLHAGLTGAADGAPAGGTRPTGAGAMGDGTADGGTDGHGEPIAIVGIGCRFPGGAASPGELWALLAAGVDAISGFPPDRGWDDDALDAGLGLGRLGLGGTGRGDDGYARSGGFVADATGFDAEFFGISPREAAAMDPQQRLMLEVAWEALERARIEPGSLRGSPTGVFTGGYSSGYEMSLIFGGDSDGPGPEGYLMTGNATSVISGRVAYALGLEGPAVTVDTACSSSLVALHLACQALRAGECGLALAGGVTVIATPGPFIEFSHQQGLAGDGRCKPFSADADGIVWGEGAGALVLERLSDARRNGHPVLAVIRGSAVNSDGASNGLTAPNGPSQQRVILAALASAGLSPDHVDAVEAHGTGTVLGDPIEAQALIATYGRDRSDDRPLWLGSVKSNLGHTGAAAGVAGVIKMVLALQHRELPPTLHAGQPSPHVAWDAGHVRLLTEMVAWPANGHLRRAGVSAFGISGTNAHMIIEEAPAVVAEPPSPADGALSRERAAEELADEIGAASLPTSGSSNTSGTPIPAESDMITGTGYAKTPNAAAGHANSATPSGVAAGRPGIAGPMPEGPVLGGPVLGDWVLTGSGEAAWPVSGKTAEALAAQAEKLAAWTAAHPDLGLAEVAWSLATTRTALEHRAVVIGTAPEDSGRPDMAAGLAALAAGQPSGQVVSGTVPPGGDPGKVAFVFPGQGSQWAGMGAELAAASPVFAARLAECSRALAPYTGWKLEDVLAGPVLSETEGLSEAEELSEAGKPSATSVSSGTGDAPDLDRVDVVQPALWAVMVSLAAVWQAAGVTPDAVAGHSQGEIAAAVVAGVLSLDDAARVVALRSRALTALAGRGGMASLALPADAVRERLTVRGAGSVQVAAVNGPNATVVSGAPDAIADLAAACAADGVRARVLAVDYASHGPQVEELEHDIRAALAGITPRPARIPMISAMTGEFLDGPEADADYWYASLRAPVEFQRAVQVLAAEGYRVFLEASPHAVLMTPVTETLEELHFAGTVTGTLRRDDGGRARLLASLAEAYAHGVSVDWAKVLPRAGQVELPTYAFRHQRFWGPSLRALLAARAGRPDRGAGGDGGNPAIAGPDGANTVVEARFWAAVEDGNLRELAADLAVDGQRPFSEVLPALASWRRRERDESVTAGWRYKVTWQPAAPSGVEALSRAGVLSGTWLLVAPSGGRFRELAAQCAQALEASGAQVDTMLVDCRAIGRDVLAGLIEDALGGEPLTGVVSLLALNETPLPDLPAVSAGLAGTIGLIQGLGDAAVKAPLWVLTRGAVAAAPDEGLPSPVQAQAWGLGRVVALEHPDRWGGLIDLPAEFNERPVLDERTGARLGTVLAAGGTGQGEDQVAIRSVGILARRMVRAGAGKATRTWTPRGSVLITGGTGAIGGHVARLAASRGAPRVVLASRSGPAAAGVSALVAELAATGTDVIVASCDSADNEALSGLVSRLASTALTGVALTAGPPAAVPPPLTSVFHAAGVPQGIPVEELSTAALDAVLGAKAAGAACLDALTAGLDLDAFVLFSSGAGIWGSGLQAGYAAANAYLDAVAASRRGRGLTATSVAWGMWGGGGMTGPQGVRELSRRGLAVMEPRLAVSALARALDGDESLLTVADIDWTRFAPAFTVRRASPLIGGVPEAREALQSAPDAVPAEGNGLRDRLTGLPKAEQDRVLTDLVRAETAAVLGHAGPEAVDPARSFKDLGIDSLTALDLRNRLAAATGLKLPSTLVYDHPNPAALAGHLWRQEFQGESTGDPLTAELDKFESLISRLVRGDEARGIAGTRLKRMLTRLDDAAGQEDGQAVARKIESATDDEILSFIHAELGR